MARWFWGYCAGCLAATPVFLTGGLLAFGAGAVFEDQDAGMALAAGAVMLPFAFMFCALFGAGPTALAHFTLRGAGRDDALSYILSGALFWGLLGLGLGAIADPPARYDGLTSVGDVHVLGWMLTTAFSGAIAAALFWRIGIEGEAPIPLQHRQPRAFGEEPLHLTAAQIVPAQQSPYAQPAPYDFDYDEPEPPAPQPAQSPYQVPRPVPTATQPYEARGEASLPHPQPVLHPTRQELKAAERQARLAEREARAAQKAAEKEAKAAAKAAEREARAAARAQAQAPAPKPAAPAPAKSKLPRWRSSQTPTSYDPGVPFI